MSRSPRRRSASRPAGPPDPLGTVGTPGPASAPPSPGGRGPETAANPTPGADTTREESAQTRRRARSAGRSAAPVPTEQRGRQDPEAGRGPRRRGGERTDPDRALRALISTRSTQLPPDIALRAREYAAPSPQELAEADRELVIVRRNYVPPTPFAAGRRSGGKRG